MRRAKARIEIKWIANCLYLVEEEAEDGVDDDTARLTDLGLQTIEQLVENPDLEPPPNASPLPCEDWEKASPVEAGSSHRDPAVFCSRCRRCDKCRQRWWMWRHFRSLALEQGNDLLSRLAKIKTGGSKPELPTMDRDAWLKDYFILGRSNHELHSVSLLRPYRLLKPLLDKNPTIFQQIYRSEAGGSIFGDSKDGTSPFNRILFKLAFFVFEFDFYLLNWIRTTESGSKKLNRLKDARETIPRLIYSYATRKTVNAEIIRPFPTLSHPITDSFDPESMRKLRSGDPLGICGDCMAEVAENLCHDWWMNHKKQKKHKQEKPEEYSPEDIASFYLETQKEDLKGDISFLSELIKDTESKRSASCLKEIEEMEDGAEKDDYCAFAFDKVDAMLRRAKKHHSLLTDALKLKGWAP